MRLRTHTIKVWAGEGGGRREGEGRSEREEGGGRKGGREGGGRRREEGRRNITLVFHGFPPKACKNLVFSYVFGNLKMQDFTI